MHYVEMLLSGVCGAFLIKIFDYWRGRRDEQDKLRRAFKLELEFMKRMLDQTLQKLPEGSIPTYTVLNTTVYDANVDKIGVLTKPEGKALVNLHNFVPVVRNQIQSFIRYRNSLPNDGDKNDVKSIIHNLDSLTKDIEKAIKELDKHLNNTIWSKIRIRAPFLSQLPGNN